MHLCIKSLYSKRIETVAWKASTWLTAVTLISLNSLLNFCSIMPTHQLQREKSQPRGMMLGRSTKIVMKLAWWCILKYPTFSWTTFCVTKRKIVCYKLPFCLLMEIKLNIFKTTLIFWMRIAIVIGRYDWEITKVVFFKLFLRNTWHYVSLKCVRTKTNSFFLPHIPRSRQIYTLSITVFSITWKWIKYFLMNQKYSHKI